MLGIKIRFERGSGRSQNNHRQFHLASNESHIFGIVPYFFFLFKRRIVFFINNDDAYVFKGSKKSTSGSNDNGNFFIFNFKPFFSALRSRQATMKYSNFALKVSLKAT